MADDVGIILASTLFGSTQKAITMGTYAGRERRNRTSRPDDLVPVRLTHKYADVIDGVDLSGHHVGERMCLGTAQARLLIAEGWAEPVADKERRQCDVRDRHDHKRCA